MALTSARTLALALPLALGLACTHGRTSQARTRTTAQGTATTAPDVSGNPASPLPGHSDDQVIAGHVTRVTEDSISIDAGQGEERVLRIVPQTIVTIDGMDASAGEIQEGQEVRAFFNTEDGRDVAVRIVSPVATDKG